MTNKVWRQGKAGQFSVIFLEISHNAMPVVNYFHETILILLKSIAWDSLTSP